MGKGCAGRKVSGCYNLLSVFFGALEIILMIDERSVMISKRAGLQGAEVEELVGCGMSICVVRSIEDVEFIVGTDVGGMSVVSREQRVLFVTNFVVRVYRLSA
jgi:hypothetical protein